MCTGNTHSWLRTVMRAVLALASNNCDMRKCRLVCPCYCSLPLNHWALLDSLDTTVTSKASMCIKIMLHMTAVSAKLLHVQRIGNTLAGSFQFSRNSTETITSSHPGLERCFVLCKGCALKYQTALGEEVVVLA